MYEERKFAVLISLSLSPSKDATFTFKGLSGGKSQIGGLADLVSDEG